MGQNTGNEIQHLSTSIISQTRGRTEHRISSVEDKVLVELDHNHIQEFNTL